MAIGDGANDSLMLNEAGIGIGFHAKEGLKKQIVNWIDFAPMDVLFIFVSLTSFENLPKFLMLLSESFLLV